MCICRNTQWIRTYNVPTSSFYCLYDVQWNGQYNSPLDQRVWNHVASEIRNSECSTLQDYAYVFSMAVAEAYGESETLSRAKKYTKEILLTLVTTYVESEVLQRHLSIPSSRGRPEEMLYLEEKSRSTISWRTIKTVLSHQFCCGIAMTYVSPCSVYQASSDEPSFILLALLLKSLLIRACYFVFHYQY